MTPLLDDTIESIPPTAPTAAFPPPPPVPPAALLDTAPPIEAAADDDRGSPNIRALAIIAGLAVAAAIVMGLAWMSAGTARDDAAAARDAAITERDAGADRARTTGDALITTQSQLDEAAAETQQLQAELDAAVAASADRAEVVQANEELSVQITDLTTRNVDLAKELSQLEADLALAAAADPAAAPFDIAAVPDFARFIGEQLSSRSGSNKLGDGQTTCLGTAVINDIGFDVLGQGLHLSATAAATEVLETSMRAAAATCGIDPSAIF